MCLPLPAGAEPALPSPAPQPGLLRPAPPVSAGSALSGCDIHPDEEAAPPARVASRAALPLPPRSRPPPPGRAPLACTWAPRPSRLTGIPGPLRGRYRSRRVSTGATAARRHRSPPVTAAGRAQSRPSPRNNCCNFPRSSAAVSSPRRAASRSTPLPAPYQQCRRRLILRTAVPRCRRRGTKRHGTEQHSSVGPVGCGAARHGVVRCGAVWYGTVRYGTVPLSPAHRSLPR